MNSIVLIYKASRSYVYIGIVDFITICCIAHFILLIQVFNCYLEWFFLKVIISELLLILGIISDKA